MIEITLKEFAEMGWNERMKFIKYCAEGNFTVKYINNKNVLIRKYVAI